MLCAIAGLMVLAGLIVVTNIRGAAEWLASHLFHQLIGKDGGIWKMRLVGVVWILFGVIAAVFFLKTTGSS